ncbi:MAG: DNA repair protein RecO [Candidatus Pacebacteria bacterium]|nr:DNA repair protein RecO [Candidatus Paceibacterota bacterium]
MAHEHYRTKGIVLAKENSGEADQIFILYTQDFGKVEVAGKAIRKITSKLKAGIDLFYFIELEFIQGKNRKTLTDAIIIDKFPNIRKNIEMLDLAGQIAFVVCSFGHIQEKDEKIWELIAKSFFAFNNYELGSLKHYFLWNFLVLLGYAPELYNCSVCSKKLLPETLFFSPQNGGVVCKRCCDFPAQGISVETVKLIRFFLLEPIEQIKRLNVSEKVLQDLDKIFSCYFDFLTEK